MADSLRPSSADQAVSSRMRAVTCPHGSADHDDVIIQTRRLSGGYGSASRSSTSSLHSFASVSTAQSSISPSTWGRLQSPDSTTIYASIRVTPLRGKKASVTPVLASLDNFIVPRREAVRASSLSLSTPPATIKDYTRDRQDHNEIESALEAIRDLVVGAMNEDIRNLHVYSDSPLLAGLINNISRLHVTEFKGVTSPLLTAHAHNLLQQIYIWDLRVKVTMLPLPPRVSFARRISYGFKSAFNSFRRIFA